MAAALRMTIPTRLVLAALVRARPGEEQFGADLGRETGLPSGTVHPILARLEGLEWVRSRWEDIDPSAQGRPARRYYQLTDAGRDHAGAALAAAERRAPVLPLHSVPSVEESS